MGKHRSGEATVKELPYLSKAALRRRWTSMYRRPAPAVSEGLLALSIAYKLQERINGGLTPAVAKRINLAADALCMSGSILSPTLVELEPGAQLLREYRGVTYRVVALTNGYRMGNQVFGSLTEIATKVTGTHYPGPRFFGLRSRKRADPSDYEG
jgi:hypothetical protein